MHREKNCPFAPARSSSMPAWFERVAAAFEEASHVGMMCPCLESPTDTDLPELVESFLEVDIGREDNERVAEEEEDDSISSDTEAVCRLRGLFSHDAVCDDVRQRIHSEVEAACVILVGDACSDDFKRQLTARLRERGFDAGFCKSKWDKTSGFPPGECSFIDVDVHGVRYVIESDLSKQFETARCTEQYRLLLDMIPPVFVERVDELKRVVRIMCSAQKRSMKKMNLHIPPWRRKGYMLSKWFGPQERSTTGDFRERGAPRAGGYFSCYCREDFSSKTRFRTGYFELEFEENDVGRKGIGL